jgi:hypothetical protein
MWISGCGVSTAMVFSFSKSCFESRMYSRFQNTSPSLFTAMTMFSGLVCVGTLRSFGSSTGTFCTTTGMVMRKMISITSITSTSGVVLIAAITSSSAPVSWPTAIAMAYLAAAAAGAGRRVPAALPLSSTMCRSAPKARRCSSATLLRRTSQL